MAGDLYEKYRPKNLPIVYTYQKFKWDQFFIGFFGALAIFGVLLKLWEPSPFWGLMDEDTAELMFQIFMPIGFLGEVAVFIIMGFLKGEGVIEVYPDEMDDIDDEEAEQASLPGVSDGGVIVNMELPESLKEIIEEKVANQIDGKLADITNLLVEDVEKTRGLLVETNEVNARIQDIASSLADFSDRIKVASDSLKQFENLSTGNISENASNVSDRLEMAGDELNNFQEEMKKLAGRFKRFNSANN